MKRAALFLLLFVIPLMAQNQQDQQDAQNQDQQQTYPTEAPGQVQWGSNFETVKANVKGTLKFFENDKRIVSEEGEITYTYGFFYADPEMTGETEDENAADEAADGEQPVQNQPAQDAENGDANQAGPNEPQFSYVVMQFPYLAMEEIKAKYVEKYGEPSSEIVEENRGVILWESEETMITMWIDEYEDKPYCRKINYLSKAFTEKLKDYKNKVFNKKEIDTLNRIQP